MSFFVVFVLLLLDTISIAYLTKRRVGRTAAAVNFSILGLAYLVGLLGRLDIGVYIALGLSVVPIGLCVGLAVKRHDAKGLSAVLKDPLLLVYALLGIALGIALFNKFSNDFDEMSHWALVVKNMRAYRNFGNLGDTTTMFNRYVPATGVWMYIMGIFNPTFVNGNCYAAFDVLLLSVLLPIPDKFHGKPAPQTIALVSCIVLVCVLKCNIFFNLRIDALLGAMGAYIYLLYWSDRGKTTAFTWLEIAIACGITTLTKTSGMVLAIIALVLIGLDVILRGRQNIKPFFARKVQIVWLLLPIAAIALAKISWELYCNLHQVRAGWNASELTMATLGQYLTNPNEFQRTVNAIFWKNFFVGRIYYGSGAMQQPFVYFAPIYALLATALHLKKQPTLGWGMFGATMVILIGYAVTNLILYIFSFSYSEALQLASWPRYFSTILIQMGLVWLALIVEICYGDKVLPVKLQKHFYRYATAALVVLAAVLAGVLNPVFARERHNTLAPHTAWCEAVAKLQPEDSVYYASDDDPEYLLLRFLATPTRCNGWQLGGSYTEGRYGGAYTGNPYRHSYTPAQLAKQLSDYDYFFLGCANNGFCQRYAELFADPAHDYTLYVVDKSGDTVQLRLWQDAQP